MSKLQPQTYYRLRELIYAKYGENKYAIGCEITARWVAFETRQPCTMEQVQIWCNLLQYDYEELKCEFTFKAIDVPHEWLISLHQARAIIKLFGVTNEYQLFNPITTN